MFSGPSFRRYLIYAFSIFSILLTAFIGYGLERSRFPTILVSFSLFFGCYSALLWLSRKQTAPFRYFITLGILLRVMLLFNLPNLSDDVFRFIWDGRMWLQGVHPFSVTPAQWLQMHPDAGYFDRFLFKNMNSGGYYTVYPPVSQAIFAFAAFFGQTRLHLAVFLIKIILFCFELGSLYWIHRLYGKKAVLVYALNPLAIVEITGNCHFEGAMLFFLLASLGTLEQNKKGLSALLLALSIASKLIPLLFWPLIWRKMGLKNGFIYLAQAGVWVFLLFLPLIRGDLMLHMASSINLYFQQFQFNASSYYLAVQIGYWKTGWNIGSKIGPWLAVAVFLGILFLTFIQKNGQQKRGIRFETALMLAAFWHFCMATTVHPWYVLLPLVLGLSGNWWYPVYWSFLVVFSYSHYSNGIYLEKYPWIVAEYVLLYLIFLVEMFLRISGRWLHRP